MVEWENIGEVLIRVIAANIKPYDASGNLLETGAKDYTIFARFDFQPGVAPGEIYVPTKDDGFVIISGPGIAPKPNRVEVEITRVLSE